MVRSLNSDMMNRGVENVGKRSEIPFDPSRGKNFTASNRKSKLAFTQRSESLDALRPKGLSAFLLLFALEKVRVAPFKSYLRDRSRSVP